jgi:hypothetical protein
LCLTTTVFCLLYVNVFEGKFDFILRDKKSHTLTETKEYSADIEDNIFCSNFNPFQYPFAKAKPKEKTTTNSAPDQIPLIVQKLDQMNTQFV